MSLVNIIIIIEILLMFYFKFSLKIFSPVGSYMWINGNLSTNGHGPPAHHRVWCSGDTFLFQLQRLLTVYSAGSATI